MNKQNKWKMNRTGLLNFWYYDDEIFDFADGKLLLRGSNGSGKSVTMQSILPVLLDGKTSSDRLDPFGSRARRMEDYLLGEKEIVNRDERTGYLFLEYKREDTNQYITTGIGLQARRHKPLNFWGFVITDNRRIGKDFFLYEHEYNAGEKQQIPLSRIQLENRIDKGGHVVRTRREYQQLVNKYIFGFETDEAYEDLIKLLIQLRSPKLSKDFRPTVIYEILEAALPPLTDEDLRHLSDTIEHMDQTKQQIEQLDREYEALKRLISRYDQYNKYRLAESAQNYLDTKKRYKHEEKTVQEKVKTEKELTIEITKLKERNLKLEQTSDILERKKNRLQTHKVWNLEEERTKEINALKETETERVKKEQHLSTKKRQLFQAEDAKDRLAMGITSIESEMDDQLIDMEADADITSFIQHELNVQDFKRNKNSDHDFTMWKKETENHEQRLNIIREQLRAYEQMKLQISDLDRKMAETRLEIDQLKHEENDWKNIFERDKQDKLTEIHQWVERYPFLLASDQLLQQTARQMHNLYETVNYENIRTPFVRLTNDFQMKMNESIATKNSQVSELERIIQEIEAELAEWKDKRDPEPPFQQDATKEAREQLIKDGYAFIPFYEAVEFQEHVPEEIRNRIEAALLDIGLLDALITSEDTPIIHDRVIQAEPNMMAHTLADYLMPDIEMDAAISAVKVDEVLRTILVDEASENPELVIREDGTYKIGFMHGHAVPVENVRFIGKNARKRYREEQIELLTLKIAERTEDKEQIQYLISNLYAEIEKSDQALSTFPDDHDLQEIHAQIKEKQFQIKQTERLLTENDVEMQQLYEKFQTIKRQLDVDTRELNIEFSYEAYEEAQNVMRRYERDLNSFITKHLTYRHDQINLQQTMLRMDELTSEIDELTGELNVLSDRHIRMKRNISEIEKQLETLGVADIRKQIQSVQTEIQQTMQELDKNRTDLPRKEAEKGALVREIAEHQQKVEFWKNMIEAWLETFQQELSFGFIQLSEEHDDEEKLAVCVIKQYGKLLKERDSANISSQLTNVFYEQLTNLMEYRMTDDEIIAKEFAWMNQEWTDEQEIFIADWRSKSSRRLIQLEFQGKRVSPYYILEVVEKDRLNQQMFLDDQDRQLYEEILYDSIGRKLRSRIYRAKQWTKKMNQLMEDSDSSSGLSFSIRWRPRTAESEAELDTKDLVDLLSRDINLLKEEDLNQVIEHFRSKIEHAKELIEIKGEGNTLLQVLKEVLDYRYWFSFVLSYKRDGEPKRELTNNAFYQFSGGEKAMAMYIPLFTACYSRYLEANETAPYIISLDEAFAGVDEDNISVMFRIVEELGFDYIMNSQVLWGDYETVKSLSVCELVRPKNASYVSVIRYYWDGHTRNLLIDLEQEAEKIR